MRIAAPFPVSDSSPNILNPTTRNEAVMLMGYFRPSNTNKGDAAMKSNVVPNPSLPAVTPRCGSPGCSDTDLSDATVNSPIC